MQQGTPLTTVPRGGFEGPHVTYWLREVKFMAHPTMAQLWGGQLGFAHRIIWPQRTHTQGNREHELLMDQKKVVMSVSQEAFFILGRQYAQWLVLCLWSPPFPHLWNRVMIILWPGYCGTRWAVCKALNMGALHTVQTQCHNQLLLIWTLTSYWTAESMELVARLHEFDSHLYSSCGLGQAPWRLG